MRLNLARALMQRAELLLLDEPTNHLDLDAVLWLEKYLANFEGTMLLISHDRDFLDAVVDNIAHIDNQQLTLYRGNYSQFERQRAEQLAQHQSTFEKQQRQVAHLQKFIDRFRAQATKAKQAQSRMKALEKMSVVDAVMADRGVKFVFPQPEPLSPPMLAFDHIDLGYTKGNPILKNLHHTQRSHSLCRNSRELHQPAYPTDVLVLLPFAFWFIFFVFAIVF
jgi:ATP-binding cassette subfamily F protein 3